MNDDDRRFPPCAVNFGSVGGIVYAPTSIDVTTVVPISIDVTTVVPISSPGGWSPRTIAVEVGRPHLGPIRQRIESICWTCEDLLTLERHGARTLPGIRERIIARVCTLAAAITLNHKLGRPSRALVQ